MPIPSNATTIPQPLDPKDVLDCEVDLSVAPTADVPAFLMPSESVASFTLALTPEASAAGLQIKADGDYPPPVIASNQLTFWVTVSADMVASPIFDGAGLRLGLELTATMSGTPPRVKQRTITVQVANQ